jgi:hypothetical protein
MGEFLTESAHLEDIMFSLAVMCQRKRRLEDIHREFLDLTFGAKIIALKKVCGEYLRTRAQRSH